MAPTLAQSLRSTGGPPPPFPHPTPSPVALGPGLGADLPHGFARRPRWAASGPSAGARCPLRWRVQGVRPLQPPRIPGLPPAGPLGGPHCTSGSGSLGHPPPAPAQPAHLTQEALSCQRPAPTPLPPQAQSRSSLSSRPAPPSRWPSAGLGGCTCSGRPLALGGAGPRGLSLAHEQPRRSEGERSPTPESPRACHSAPQGSCPVPSAHQVPGSPQTGGHAWAVCLKPVPSWRLFASLWVS